MRKYIKMTAGEAIANFMQKDTSFAPETTTEIRDQIREILKYPSDNCVSVIIPTHRIFPETKEDAIMLKNAVRQAEKMLAERTDKRTAAKVIENIREAQESVDNSINYECLVLYANEHFSTVVKLPVAMPESVAVGPYFDFRPLNKSMMQNERYYILTISKKNLRLMEAHNDKAVFEFDNEGFPFANEDYYTTDPMKLAQDDFTLKLLKEYFNAADKYFQRTYNLLPLPLVLAGDVKMVAYYESQMDNKEMVIARLHGSYDEMTPQQITDHAYPLVKEYQKLNKQATRQKNAEAQASGTLLDNPSQIYEAAAESRIETLYLTDNFVTWDHHEPVGGRLPDATDALYVSNDLLEMIRKIREASGNAVVYSPDEESKEAEIYAITRY